MDKKKLHIYNTLSKKKELFKPIDENVVKLYSCGVTVYSNPHIGNMRAYTFVDTLVRSLKLANYEVLNLINITDVGHLTSDADQGEDKIEMMAKKTHKSAYEIADAYTNIFYDYLNDLNIVKPHMFPKATDHINEQIDMIKTLEDKGYTYRTDDGIYFDTSKFDSYKDFANINIEGLREGVRVDVGGKKNKTDFALWKFSPEFETREMEWESPWGIGFPGWHIECSAMAMKYLGTNIDIHTGGIDHINIHHTNEIAQSEAVTGERFVNYWMHVNFLQLQKEDTTEDDDTKMSKSKGTAYTLHQLRDLGYPALVVKYFYLTAHYRNELKFNFEILDAIKKTFEKLQTKVYQIKESDAVLPDTVSEASLSLIDILLDDLDTPRVLAKFHEIINSELSNDIKLDVIHTFDEMFGLGFLSYEKKQEKIPNFVIEIAEKRLEVRNNKDWAKSDELRNQIKELGFNITDNGATYDIKKID